jgi:hypothetical protein
MPVRFWITLLVALPLTEIACQQQESAWQLDSQYSQDLTILAPNFPSARLADLKATVSAVQIYVNATGKNLGWVLPHAPGLNLLYETRDASVIARVLDSISRGEVHVAGCIGRGNVHYVFMFDHELLRVGCFRFYRCKVSEKEYAVIEPFQAELLTSTIYYNESLPTVFREVGIP